MASKLGTVFVELTLDDKVYKQKLSETLTSATATAKGIETSWKALGTKSDAIFNAQAQAAKNAYTLIKNSASSTANDIERAQKAMNDRLSQINRQQFGEQESLLSKMKSNWLATMAVIGTAVATAMQAWHLAKAGADYAEQQGILNNLARKYQTTADEIVSSMERASEGMIAKVDLMKIALGGVSKGLVPEQLINLADAAKILGDAAGVSATTALNELTMALETGRTRGLKTYLGTALDLETTFGDLASKMTAAEKAQAMYSITMLEATKLQAQQTEKVDESADELDKLEAKYKNLTLTISTFMKSLVVGLLVPRDTRGILDDNGMMLMTDAQNQQTEAVKKTEEATKKLTDKYQTQIDALKKLLQARTDDTEAIKRHRSEAQKHAEFMERVQEKALMKEGELIEARDREEKEYFDNLKREQEQAIKDAERLATDRVKAERDIYKDLRKYSGEYFNETRKLIADQAKKYKELGLSEGAISAWVKEETIRAYIEMGQKSDDWADGVQAAFLDIQRSATTWGKAAFDMIKSFSSSSSRVLSDVFFDGFKGELKSFKDYWTSWTDALLRSFVDMLAKMAVEWITMQMFMGQTTLGIGAGGSALAAGLGGASGIGIGLTGAGTGAALGFGLNSMVTTGDLLPSMGINSMGSATVGQLLGAAGLGYMGGTMLGGALFGPEHSTAAGIGGALGAGAGMFFGPGGAIVGDLIGTTLGGLGEDIVSGVGDVFSSIGDVFGFSSGGHPGFQSPDRYTLPAYVWANAPHAARGLRLPDGGIPIVAHPGERVLNPSETRAYERGGGFSGTIQVFLDGHEIPGRVKVIADGVVVERNKRGVSSTRRIYQ